MKSIIYAGLVCSACLLLSCTKNSTTPTSTAKINFVFKFDSTQQRLNGFGVPTNVPAGHGAQSPRFNSMSAHYVELTPTSLTPLGGGQILYRANEVVTGGSNAIEFASATLVGNNQAFLSIPISNIAAGNYNYLRVSLAYQNYNVYVTTPFGTIDATLASFIGFNTYINNFKIKDSTVTVNANKQQGFWAFEGKLSGVGFVQSGQAPAGATTVPNPLFATSAVPAGSCVVTGAFATPLSITGNETNDITIEVSLSTNKSFEWTETDGNNLFNPLAPNNDKVIDMGIRGMLVRKL